MTDMITAKGKAANKVVLNSELVCCDRLMKRLATEARETVDRTIMLKIKK